MTIEYRLNACIDLTQLGRLFKQAPWASGRSASGMATITVFRSPQFSRQT